MNKQQGENRGGQRVPIFVINLPSDAERLRSIETQLRALALDFRVQEAVRGSALSDSDMRRLYDGEKAVSFKRPLARELTRAEIGCALSHLAVYKKLEEENLDCALILEDDAQLFQEVPVVLERLVSKIKSDSASIVLLTRARNYRRWGTVPLDYARKLVFLPPCRRWDGAHGYFITRKTAKILSEKLFPVWSVADDFNQFQEEFGITLMAVVPYCISLTSHCKTSNILPETKKLPKASTRSADKRTPAFYLREYLWERAFFRLFVFPFLVKKQGERVFDPPCRDKCPPIFVVNLPTDVERRHSVEAQLNTLGLTARFQDGILGSTLSPKELAQCYAREKAIRHERELSLPEIGCALAHHAIYKKIIAENLPGAIILEDDCALYPDAPEVFARLANRLETTRMDVALCSFVRSYFRWGKEKLDAFHFLAKPDDKRYAHGGHGYFVTRKGAEILLQNCFPFWSPCDHWCVFQKKFGLRVSVVVPQCVGLSNEITQSNIEGKRSSLTRSVGLWEKLKRIFWKKTIYRLFVFPLTIKRQNLREGQTRFM
ncbi:MAG: glycosyltransferase family 25 protein [Puniceicoccales bacterium]|jgi:glycosyl transferase family 25|nr:glycosyltransferase family 25 protein [Puniceicoccales bacterium]